MILYLIKSTLCLALMLVVYVLFLEKEKMYRFNRFYLIFSVVFSFLVPLIIIEGNSQVFPELSSLTAQRLIREEVLSTQTIVLVIYGLITSALLFRLIRNIYLVLLRGSKNKRIPFHAAELVLVKNNAISHNFWNYIFVDADDYVNQRIPKEVFTHELAHAKQKHTLDVLFIELLRAMFWFNPFLILYRRAIQMNHEFLADEAVVLAYNNPIKYQLLLLNNISNPGQFSLSSSLNYRVTKKRLIMLASKPANRKTVLLKKLGIVPVTLLAVFLFSTKAIDTDQSLRKISKASVNIDIPVSIEIIPLH